MDKETLIKALELTEHPFEQGYFRRTYQSKHIHESGEEQRRLMSSIFYLLTEDSPIGCLHKNRSDIIHYFHLGAPIKYFIISESGELRQEIMGPDILAGHKLQLLVKGGEWKASQLVSGEYGLISEAVSPGFEYQDNQIATREDFAIYPHILPHINHLIFQ